MSKSGQRRHCHWCGTQFGESTRSGRIAVTTMDNKAYEFFMFHRQCMLRHPKECAAIILGIVPRSESKRPATKWGSYV